MEWFAMVVVDASLVGPHSVRWHWVTLHIDGMSAGGLPVVRPE